MGSKAGVAAATLFGCACVLLITANCGMLDQVRLWFSAGTIDPCSGCSQQSQEETLSPKSQVLISPSSGNGT